MKFFFPAAILVFGFPAFGASATFTPVTISKFCHRIEGTGFWDCHHSQIIHSPVSLELKEGEWPGESSGEWSFVRGDTGYFVSVARVGGGKGAREVLVSLHVGTKAALKEKRYDEMASATTHFPESFSAGRVAVLGPSVADEEGGKTNIGFAVDDLVVEDFIKRSR